MVGFSVDVKNPFEPLLANGLIEYSVICLFIALLLLMARLHVGIGAGFK